MVQFALRNEESIFELILTQGGKLQVDFQSKGDLYITISRIPNVPYMIEEHRNHKIYPLELLHLSANDNDTDDSNDDRRTLICNGCIQPITVSHSCYYACTQCRFFLQSFCAIKLPIELPAGTSSFHPNTSSCFGRGIYSLILWNVEFAATPQSDWNSLCILALKDKTYIWQAPLPCSASISNSKCSLSEIKIYLAVEYA